MTHQPVQRVSLGDTNAAIAIAVQPVADVFDDRLVVADCVRAGKRSRSCRVDLDGAVPFRLRVVVTRTPHGDFRVRARLR